MNTKRIALAAALAAAGLLAVAEPPAAPAGRPPGAGASGPRHPGGVAPGGQYRPAHPGGYRPGHGSGSHHHGFHGYGSSSYWGWGVGIGVGIPLALGWYDPYWWGSPYYYPSYSWGPAHGLAYGGYGYACAPFGDCGREYAARNEPAPPTTEVPPPVPGEDGGPTQRPLHLNYCDSAGAWFPHVRSCPGGWRLVLPEYRGTAP